MRVHWLGLSFFKVMFLKTSRGIWSEPALWPCFKGFLTLAYSSSLKGLSLMLRFSNIGDMSSSLPPAFVASPRRQWVNQGWDSFLWDGSHGKTLFCFPFPQITHLWFSISWHIVFHCVSSGSCPSHLWSYLLSCHMLCKISPVPASSTHNLLQCLTHCFLLISMFSLNLITWGCLEDCAFPLHSCNHCSTASLTASTNLWYLTRVVIFCHYLDSVLHFYGVLLL